MRHALRIMVVIVAVLAGSLAGAWPAAAATIVVEPGQSIQAAVNKAAPGDVVIVEPGVYHENVTIRKPLTLRGSGASYSGTVIAVPATPHPTPCVLGPGEFVGICAAGQVDFNTGQVKSYLPNVTIEDFLVKGFPGPGILGIAVSNFVVSQNRATTNHDYGIVTFIGKGVTYGNNTADHNDGPAFYFGDSQTGNLDMHGNTSESNNGYGMFVRNSSTGKIVNNSFDDNCAGALFLANAPGPVNNWAFQNNEVLANNRLCPGQPSEGEPSVSGVGVVLDGARNVLVGYNTVSNNRPSAHSDVPTGGIVLIDKAGNNIVQYNVAYKNLANDIFWDRTGTGNVFRGNTCDRSNPAFICQ